MSCCIYEGIEKCCFTGYRPAKFPFSLNRDDSRYKKFENTLIEELLRLIDSGCTTFISGMAMGFDIIAAETVLMLKKAYNTDDIKLICVLPFPNQSDGYTTYWKNRYNNVLEQCDKKVILSDDYFQGCYQKRNIFMVDNSDCVLTWYDGKAGGTRNTIDYAISKKRYVINTCKEQAENFAIQTFFDVI